MDQLSDQFICFLFPGDHAEREFLMVFRSSCCIETGQKSPEPEFRIEFEGLRRIKISDARLFPIDADVAVCLNGHKKQAQPCLVLVFGKVLFQRGLFDLIQMAVYPVHTSIVNDQLRRGLLSDFGYARHVVGAVPHERFYVDEGGGCDLIGLQYVCRVIVFDHSLALSGLGDPDAGVFRGDLQKIAVTRYDGDFHPRLFTSSGECAEDIVRLQSRLFPDLHAHGLQDFFDQGNLLAQFLRHGFSRPFIFLICLMAERRRVYVKRHRQIIRFFLIQDLEQNVQKPVYSACVYSGGICEVRHPVKGPVQNTVPVHQHQLFSIHYLQSSLS